MMDKLNKLEKLGVLPSVGRNSGKFATNWHTTAEGKEL
jgi:hypothetical protein